MNNRSEYIETTLPYCEEHHCVYKNEEYLVRDNGAIMRMARTGKAVRELDNFWTLGKIKNEKGEGGWRFMGEAVHRIVAAAFLGDPPSQKENKILHLDRNPFNNCPCNLRWASNLELTIWRKESNFRIRQLTGASIREFLSNPQNYRHCFDYEIDLDWLCSVWPETTHRALKKIEKWEEELGTSCVLDVPSPNAATEE